jgi:hypothetical protein
MPRLYQAVRKKESFMTTWKGAFLAVLMSGIVVGILLGHLAVWTGIGAALGAVLASRERQRTRGAMQLTKSQDQSRSMGKQVSI